MRGQGGLAIGNLLLTLLTPWLAHAEEGETAAKLVEKATALWTASCPVNTHGLCLKAEPPATVAKGTPRACTGNRTSYRLLARRQGKAGAAQKLFARALALSKVGATAACASFYRAEAVHDEYLRVRFPAGLDFSGRKERSAREFAGYLDTVGKLLRRASDLYSRTIALRDAHWAVASAARLGQLYHRFADTLALAPIPKLHAPASLSPEVKKDFLRTFTVAYCEALLDKARPLEQKAIQGYRICRKKAEELGVADGEWAKLCESELKRLRREGIAEKPDRETGP